MVSARTRFAAVFALLFLLPASPALSAPASSPRLLIHLLEYLSSDYQGAVSEQGKVISASEYQEQEEFAESALTTARSIPDLGPLGEFEKLKRLIDQKARPEEVARLAGTLKQRVVEQSGLADAPEHWPSLARGQRLFAQNCASCHGTSGSGDGPAAASLNPEPANFHSESLARNIFPLRAFNSIRLGVQGTAMAGWPQLSDEDTWALSFYVTSLHAQDQAKDAPAAGLPALPALNDAQALRLAATLPDGPLLAALPGDSGTKDQKRAAVLALRLRSGGDSNGDSGSGSGGGGSLKVARASLQQAETAWQAHDFKEAREKALFAYLEGVEPVEPRLRQVDPAFLVRLESDMARLRSTIEAHSSSDRFDAELATARQDLDQAGEKLAPGSSGSSNAWMIFFLTAGILLREGFEAVLILVALLAVIRASDSRQAAWFVHTGWVGALGCGVIAWFVSGWLMVMSGAAREKLEGYTSLAAVGVLMYVGFWLHRRTEISRWKHFIEDQVKGMLTGGKLWGLATISFMAVFREAFETVLFLRAITLESGSSASVAMGLGVASSLVATFVLSWLLLRSSARLPVRKIFTFSSVVMIALAVILTGKGIHSLQEAGVLSFTYWSDPSFLRSDFLGVYPTWETLLPQLVVLLIVTALWRWNSLPSRPGLAGIPEGNP